eukprot:TRINITY_DN4953_c0_g1_i1.p1 TRINITY_DN4953_c0_g1~~TRINITY_DN4953_c0_g1_i1.p1  ORF type:complete len:448 (-),score=131.28 TRINITY_DN4953_c0_g1_i1:46-1368(-)
MAQANKKSLDNRRDKLVELMVQKVDKINQKLGNPRFDKYKVNVAKTQVCEIIRSGTVTESDLRRIAQTLSPVRDPTVDRNEPPIQPPVTETNTVKLPQIAPVDDMWARLTAISTAQYQNDVAANKEKERQRKREQKQALDLQVAAHLEQKAHQKELERQFEEEEKKKQERWQNEQHDIKERRRQQHKHEQQVREAQAREFAERRLHEVELRRQEEMKIAERIQRDIEAEHHSELEKKQKERADVAKFLDYNKKQRDLKTSLAVAELEADKQHQREFLAKLEQQDLERELALKRMYDRQQYQAAMAEKLQHSLAKQQRKAVEQEDKAYTDMYQRMLQEEAKKKEQDKLDQERIRQVLAEQIRIKEEERDRERSVLLHQRHMLSADIKEAEAREVHRRLQRRDAEMRHRAELRRQIQDKYSAPPLSMTETEVRLNAKLLNTM